MRRLVFKFIFRNIYIYKLGIVVARYTNFLLPHEEDMHGLTHIKLDKSKIIVDVGASDGVATKYFNNNLDTGTIFCFEPNPCYYKLLKKINYLNVIVKPYAIGANNTFRYAYHPRYKFLNKSESMISDIDKEIAIFAPNQ